MIIQEKPRSVPLTSRQLHQPLKLLPVFIYRTMQLLRCRSRQCAACVVAIILIGYIISPFDLISESRYGISGIIDDVVAMVMLVAVLNYTLSPLTTLWVIYVVAWCTLTSWIIFVCPLYAECGGVFARTLS